MIECDNSKIHISSTFLLSTCLIIITLQHFATLHQTSLSLSGITSSIVYIFHIYPTRVTCAAHLVILLDLITRQASVV